MTMPPWHEYTTSRPTPTTTELLTISEDSPADISYPPEGGYYNNNVDVAWDIQSTTTGQVKQTLNVLLLLEISTAESKEERD